jgi:dsDNA-binding SOS-regulon protein
MEAARPYTIEMNERDGYVHVLVSGERLSANIAAGYWNEIAQKCFELDCRRVLIEKNFKETVRPDEMLHMADHVGSLLPNRRIAFVDRYHHDSINELGKRLARNRSVVMQIFENIDDAERWLLAN